MRWYGAIWLVATTPTGAYLATQHGSERQGVVLPSGWVLSEWREALEVTDLVQEHVRFPIRRDRTMQPDPYVREYTPPGRAGPAPARPTFSLVVNMHNRPQDLDLVIPSMLISTRGTFELVLFCDGCNKLTLEKTGEVVEASLGRFTNGSCESADIARKHDGDTAGYIEEDLYRPHGGAAMEVCEGLRGAAFASRCGTLTRVLLVDQRPAVWETAGNNRGALLSQGRYIIMMQDDMVVTEVGWNLQLALPARLGKAVFSVSARCSLSPSVGRCGQKMWTHPMGQDMLRKTNRFIAAERAVRGPLLFPRDKFLEIGLFKEACFRAVDDDKELTKRAFEDKGWISGFVAINHRISWGARREAYDSFHQDSQGNGFASSEAQDAYVGWRHTGCKMLKRKPKQPRPAPAPRTQPPVNATLLAPLVQAAMRQKQTEHEAAEEAAASGKAAKLQPRQLRQKQDKKRKARADLSADDLDLERGAKALGDEICN